MKLPATLRLFLAGSVAALLAAHPAHAALVGYWNFNENTGTTANDFTANNNVGTLVAGGGGAPSWVTGHTGNAGDNALQFRGWNDRVTIPVTTALGVTNSFTIALWAKADYLGSYVYPFTLSNNANGDARQWFIQSDNGGGDQMYMWSDANGAWNKGLGFKVGGGGNANAWHHYALTYSGGVVTSYVDGTLMGTYGISGSPSLPGFTNLLIGGRNAAWSSWEGPIDDVVIFNSVESVTTIMNGTHPAMLGYWTGTTGPTYNWNTASNWGGTLPVSTRALIFDTSNGLTTNSNDFAANKQFRGITFQATAGAFTLSGNAVNLTGDVTNNSAAAQTIATPLVLDGGTRTFNAAAGDLALTTGITQAASQTNGLTKSGNNTLTLAGTSTYAGATSVNAGKLLLNSATLSNSAVTVSGAASTLAGTGTVSQSVTVQSDAHLAPGLNAATPGTLTLGSSATGLTLNSAKLDLKLGALGSPGTTSDLISVTGSLTLAGSSSVNVSLLGDFPAAGGSYEIINYTGSLINGGPLLPPTNTLQYSYRIDTSPSSSKVLLIVFPTPPTKTWVGKAGGVNNGTWNIGTTQNWVNSLGAAAAYAEGDPVVFNDDATGTTAVSLGLGTTVNPGSVTFSNVAKPYTISGSGAIAGSTVVTVSGGGSVTLSNANTFVGDTVVSSGTLTLDHANALAGSTLNHDSPGGTLNFGVTATTLGGLKGTQSLVLNQASNPVTLSVGGNNQDTQYAGTLSGNGSLTKVGSGTLTLTSAAIYLGNTTVTTGTLTATALENTAQVIVNGGKLNAQSYNSAAPLSVAVGAEADLSGTGLTLADVTNDGTVRFTGGSGAITLASLSGGGITTIAAGADLGTLASGTVFFNGATASVATLDDAAVQLASGTALAVASGTQTTGSITGAGRLIKTGSGILSLDGTNNYAGGTTINGGTLSFGSAGSLPAGSVSLGGGTLEFTGSGAAGTYSLSVSGGLSYLVNATHAAGTLTVTRTHGNYDGMIKGGVGTVILANNFQDSGGLQVDAGTVILNGTSNNPVNWSTTNTVSDVKSGATLKLGTASVGQIYYDGGFTMSGGTFDLNGYAGALMPAVAGSGTITNNAASTTGTAVFKITGTKTFTGNVVDGGGAGKMAVTLAAGSGTWILSGANTYTGDTTVNSGTLVFNAPPASGNCLAFVVTASSNNKITGTGSATLNGPFFINLSDPSLTSLSSHTWPLVDVATKIYGTGFKITGADGEWTPSPGVWTKTDGTKTWTFTQSTGELKLSSGTTYQVWASTHGLTGTPGSATDPAFDADPDRDGIANGLEWILGGLPLAQDAASILPHATGDATTGLTLTFTREEDSIGQATLIVEYGAALTSWPKSATIGATGTGVPDLNGTAVTINTAGTPDEVTVNIPATNASNGKLFARLKAILP
ncbi:MAG: autotransporter-associated beta strand repeat-containing protein [Verrucomicrobia bacterium]|nr:autotransporter-associated beta strand repeat-containing protein [Verrucomicrobiota bacterium]